MNNITYYISINTKVTTIKFRLIIKENKITKVTYIVFIYYGINTR